MSFLGDSDFVFNNFTPWVPLGVFSMPYDLIILAILAIVVFVWGYKANIKKEIKEE